MVNFGPVDALALLSCLWLTYRIVKITRSRARTTKLTGPPSKSWLFGVSKEVFDGDNGAIYEAWSQTYGPVFQVAGPLGERRVILTDPKAVAHFYAKSNIYVKDSFTKLLTEDLIGKGIIWADGSDHKRQRKALNPPFTNASIKELVSIFYESGYKAKIAWDDILSKSSGEAVINVQKWMNCVSLDTIGIAGFGHDFGALRGEHGIVEKAFESLNDAPPVGLAEILTLLGPLFPLLTKLPTKRQKTLKRMNKAMLDIATELLEKTKKDTEEGNLSASSRSIMGALIRSESADSKSTLTKEEIISQMQTLILAGYETTSISLTWALVELSLNPDKQDKLRKEIMGLANGEDPNYDQLMNELPYLNGVLRETLRVHAPVETNDRTSACDDVMPLIESVKTASGDSVNQLQIGAGTPFIVPIRAINRSEKFWGSDAKEFKPERWLDQGAGLMEKSKELPGYHHMLTFIDGPRICLGKLFAVAEFKAVLSVLIRNFVFEMRDGPETKVETVITLLPRPKIAGDAEFAMPLRVRRYEA